jgi:hypothetical protein
MGKTVDLYQLFPLGTTGDVIATLETPAGLSLYDSVSQISTPPYMVSARILTTGDAPTSARADVSGVVATLYTHWDSTGYIRWRVRTLYQGTERVQTYLFATPESSTPVNVGTLEPLEVGPLLHGVTRVRVLGGGLTADITSRELRLQALDSGGVSQLATPGAADDEQLELMVLRTDIAVGTWVYIDPFGLDCEVRQITGIADEVLSFAGQPLKSEHDLHALVMFAQQPDWCPFFFGAVGGETDDTLAWNAAKNDMPGGGGTMTIPRGVHTTNFVMDKPGLHVICAGRSSRDETSANYIQPADPDLPAITFGDGVNQIRDMLLAYPALYGNDEAAIGLEIKGGSYLGGIYECSAVNFVDHCIKLGDIHQTKFVSRIHFGGTTVVQPSHVADAIGLGLYGNSGSNYTTAITFENLHLLGVEYGNAIVCDGAPNNYIAGYVQINGDHGVKFARTTGSFPHIFAEGLVLDTGDADAIAVELITGTPLLTSYLSGDVKIVGQVTDGGTHTYTAPPNMASSLRDPLMLEAWLTGFLRAADVTNPEFNSAPNMGASGKDWQFNTFGGGKLRWRPNNRDTYAPSVWPNIGLVLPSFITTAKPVADVAPGALIQVSNEATGAPIEFSTPRIYTWTVGGVPTGGYYVASVAVDGGTALPTGHIAWNATASDVQTALQALANIGTSNLTVKLSGNVFTLTASGPLIGLTLAFTFDNHLTGGTSPSVVAASVAGAWEQIASRNRDNGFVVGQGVRTALSPNVAAGLHVAGFPTDTTSAGYFGRNDATYAQTALRAMSGSSYGVWAESISGYGLLAKSQSQAPVQAIRQDAVTDAVSSLMKILHRMQAGSIPDDGIGTSITMYSSTNNAGAEHLDDPMLHFQAEHDNADYASYTSIGKIFVYDRATNVTTGRLALSMRANGADVELGFGDAVPVARPTVGNDATDLASAEARVNELLAGVIALGLFKRSGGSHAPVVGSSGHESLGASTLLPAGEAQTHLLDPSAQPAGASALDASPDHGGGAPTGSTPDVVYEEP